MDFKLIIRRALEKLQNCKSALLHFVMEIEKVPADCRAKMHF